MRKFLCEKYQKEALQFLKPPDNLQVSEWAERYRILDSKTTAMAGRWNNDVTPYLKGIMDEFNGESEEIVFVKPTQIGGTESLNNMIGYIVMQDPGSVLIVYPSENLAESISENRLKPMFKLSPELREHFKEYSSQKLELQFDNMYIILAGAGSPANLSSHPMRYVFMDEVDKYPGASKREADPIKLAKERTRTFRSNKKIFITSTPTLKTGHIWKEKESADAEKHFFVPCPHCGESIELKFAQLVYSKDESMSIADRAETAHYVCQKCGCIINDRHKASMLNQGEWKYVIKKTEFVKKVAYWINILYSPLERFASIVKEYLISVDDPEKLQNFHNSWLAIPWENTKLKTSEELLLERQTSLPELVLPNWTKLLTGGVDVQENCLYWTIRAWGNFSTSQNIAHGQAFSLSEIEKIMNLSFEKENGEKMVVDKCLIDSGDQTEDIYEFCLYNQDWALPCKGASNPLLNSFKISTINKVDSKANGMQLVIVDGSKYKDSIAARMLKPNGKGSWMVHGGCDDNYAKQVTAEQKVVENGKEVWKKKTTHADNHYLDCEVYAYCAADLLNLRMLYLEDEQNEVETPEEQHIPEEKWIKNNENWF